MVEISDLYLNIWPINPVLLEFIATITNWSVIVASYKDTDKKTHHLLGDLPGRFGSVSSTV